jgi:hypothetical protein
MRHADKKKGHAARKKEARKAANHGGKVVAPRQKREATAAPSPQLRISEVSLVPSYVVHYSRTQVVAAPCHSCNTGELKNLTVAQPANLYTITV